MERVVWVLYKGEGNVGCDGWTALIGGFRNAPLVFDSLYLNTLWSPTVAREIQLRCLPVNMMHRKNMCSRTSARKVLLKLLRVAAELELRTSEDFLASPDNAYRPSATMESQPVDIDNARVRRLARG